MNRKFFLTALITSAVNLVLQAVASFAFLQKIYAAYPAGSDEYMRQLNRPHDQLVIWALLVSALAFGFLITTAIKWSGARSFGSGLKYGFILGLLFWTGINFGLFSAQNIFSLPGLLADLACSVSAMTLSGAVAAWLLGRSNQDEIKPEQVVS
jgi:hypothetical protein